ncbi:mCG144587, partial [Mus musculus]
GGPACAVRVCLGTPPPLQGWQTCDLYKLHQERPMHCSKKQNKTNTANQKSQKQFLFCQKMSPRQRWRGTPEDQPLPCGVINNVTILVDSTVVALLRSHDSGDWSTWNPSG